MIPDNVIQESTRKVLLEYMGISTDVRGASMGMYDRVIGLFEKYAHEPVWNDSGFVTQDSEPILSCDFRVYTDGTKAEDIVSVMYATFWCFDGTPQCDLYDSEGLFDEHDRAIYINICVPGSRVLGKRTRAGIFNMISHEMMHAFRYCKKGNSDSGKIYDRYIGLGAAEYGDNTSKALAEHMSTLAYALSDEEINSFVQGMYSEAMMGTDIRDTEEYKTYRRIQRTYRKVMYATPKYLPIIDRICREDIGVSLKQFRSYCERGMRKFEKKLRKVFQLIQDKY